jgi:hypothetical protein
MERTKAQLMEAPIAHSPALILKDLFFTTGRIKHQADPAAESVLAAGISSWELVL